MEPGDETNQSFPGNGHAEDGAGTTGQPDELGDTWQPDASADAGSGGSAAGGRGRSEQAARMREMAQHWVGQLQEMIDQTGREAGPVLRDVAAKAAELAAVAAENAGPIAHRAANATERVGDRLATRSKELALELRHAAESEHAQPPAGDVYPSDGPGEPPSGGDSTAV